MYPWRRILIPTDFSTASEWAFDGAIPIAGATGAEIVILHIRMTKPDAPERLRFPADDSLYSYAENTELDRLREHVKRANASLPTRLVVRKAPDPGAEICRAAAEESVDLIAMSTHARHHVAHLLIGSTTMSVLKNPPSPLLAIRYGTKRRRGLRRIVVPAHLQQTSVAAAELAAKIARAEGSEVHLVMVCSVADVVAANERLDELAERIFGGVAAKQAIAGDDVERELAKYCEQVVADALFLNAGSEIGAVKRDIIRAINVPVMIVPV